MSGRRQHCGGRVIEPHLDAVGGATAVDHRHAGKARPVGLEEQSAAWLRRRRSAVDEDGEGATAPVTFSGSGSGFDPLAVSSSRAPSGGNRM